MTSFVFVSGSKQFKQMKRFLLRCTGFGGERSVLSKAAFIRQSVSLGSEYILVILVRNFTALFVLFVCCPGSHLVVGHPDLDRFVVLQGGRRNDVLLRMAGGAQDHVGVALQLLNDLARLQIPDVDQVIFRAGHDPLAAGHREIGENAVLFVLQASVVLQTLALRVVPQFERVVQGGGENVLAIRRELHKGDR